MHGFKTIKSECVGEIEEKKSRFIATLRPVETEKEAVDFINEMKKKYWDARHNCSAFVIGEKGELTRCSDDGEPSGTAGRPMLELLLNEEIRNVAVVVTRYFGGVLLGTGGLVRAYQAAVKEGINNADIVTIEECFECFVKSDYKAMGKVKSLVENKPFILQDILYEEAVIFRLMIPCPLFEEAKKSITDISNGRLTLEKEGKKYFGV
ncbi:MAG: YigZ family protein [Lachnospiraceae bacterium]|nr:YigZ family protein [Lachnospiraceae bacterium]